MCETGPVASGSPLATISSTNGDISIQWKVSSADVPYYQNKELQFICEYSAINPRSGVYEVISSPIDLIALQLDDESNYQYAALKDFGTLTVPIAAYPSRQLNNGESVRVV